MPRQPLAAVLVLGAVLGALVTDAVATYSVLPRETASANRGWNAPSGDVIERLGGS